MDVTLPTRSKNELGTGAWGFAAWAEFFQQIGPVTPFATLGRSFFASDSLDDRFFASVGGSIELSEFVAAGFSYDWLEETSGETPDAQELVPFLVLAVSPRLSIGPYGVLGLSSGSPDDGFGVSMSFAP